MFLLRFWPRPAGLLLVVLLALNVACTRKTVSFNSQPENPTATEVAVTGDSLTTTKDQPVATTPRKGLFSRQKDQAQGKLADLKKDAASTQIKVVRDTPKTLRKRKNIFLGERIKRAYVKSGPKGKNQIIEIFYYLRKFQQPNPMAPARFYYSAKKHKLFKATGELNAATDKVLHGPYKKLQNNKILETGYYAYGTKHLRWERFDTKGGLVAKSHYEQGFPRDANISYFDTRSQTLKEVVPYVNGKLEGDYARYLADGQREWTGQFENGRRIGEWTNYWGYKNYRRYVYQYGETGYDPEITEPELVREYSRGGTVLFDKEKNIDRRNETDADPTTTTGNDKPDPRRPGSHGVPPARTPVRKPAERRPGYHPKATPPAVPATPGGTPEPAGTQ